MEASDQGNPERTSEVVVNVNVKRDSYTPQFQGDYEPQIDVNHPVNSTPVVKVRASDRDQVVRGLLPQT